MNTFFDFSDRHKAALINFLQDSLAKNNEFEIRFGKFDYNKQLKQTTFNSNFEPESFYNLKKMLKHIPNKQIVTKEFIYKNPSGNGNIKKIINMSDNTETILLKNTLKKYDVYDYNLRFSSSYEKTKGVILDENLECTLIRNKQRTSYLFEYGHLDLTIVAQSKDGDARYNQTKYEVELEITKNDIPSIMSLISVILQTRQDNYYIISEFEKRHVIENYKKIINASFFVGVQPETLHKDKISSLYKENYSVTDKADGERAFMYIDNNKNIYFIDNNLNKVSKSNLQSTNYFSTIIDGEIIKHKQQIYFLAFDLLCYNNIDLRENQEYTLKPRLSKLGDILATINNSDYYIIQMKKFYYTNVFMGSKIIMNSINDKIYKNDGLIFTPINEPYPKRKKWSKLLKWKPVELNSIDLYSVKISSENGIGTWQLYVQHHDVQHHKQENNSTDNQADNQADNKKMLPSRTKVPLPSRTIVGKVPLPSKVLFDISKLCENVDSQIITYETTFPETTIDPTTDESYMSNTVIEYNYNFKLEKFVPIRTRWDKTFNPRKHGNFSTVACDIWNNIHNPIEKELLFQFTTNSKNDIYFEKMRRFHNKVKETLYNKYCNNIDNLLELCSGKGGDLHKWLFNNIKHVTGYDISEKNISECKRRISTLPNKNTNKNTTSFYHLDLTNTNSPDIIYTNNPKGFDVVSCQFGIHYFFSSESCVNNIINILNKSLNDNGYFIITFLDNRNIDKLFGEKDLTFYEKDLTFYEKDNEIMYLLERESQEGVSNKRQIYGNKLNITLNGNNILGEGSQEWIINYEHFSKLLNSNGYTLVESELFENIYNTMYNSDNNIHLSECEKNISFLNRYCVFQKTNYTEQNSLSTHTLNTLTDIKKEYNFETIDLQQKNISVYKISCLYDIVDLLNCIEYKYYKNQIENLLLEENVIININNLFTDLQIEYTPRFIKDPLNLQEYHIGKNNIYFTNYKHTIEKNQETNTNDKNATVEYNNWYIIMHHDKILFDKPTVQEDPVQEDPVQEDPVQEDPVQEDPVQEDPVQEDPVQENVDTTISNMKSENMKSDYEMLQKGNKKITIKILKELLSKYNFKTSGNKDELQNRLNQLLN